MAHINLFWCHYVRNPSIKLKQTFDAIIQISSEISQMYLIVLTFNGFILTMYSRKGGAASKIPWQSNFGILKR